MTWVVNAYQYLVLHWAAVVAVLACLASVVGTIRNLLDDGKHPVAETWLGRLLDVLAWVSAHGSRGLVGRFSVPGLPSRPNGDRK